MLLRMVKSEDSVLEEMVLSAVFHDEPQMWLEEGRVYVLKEMVLLVADYDPQIKPYSEFPCLIGRTSCKS